MSLEGARLARRAADDWTSRTPEKPRFVAGSLGPLERHALALAAGRRRRLSRGHLRPGSRDVRGADRRAAGRRRRPAHGRDDLRHAERQGRDRRRRATSRPSSRSGSRSPLWTGADATSPARPSEAFWVSVEHAEPFIVGVNCSLGATEMRPFLEGLANVASTYVSCHPNAGFRTRSGSTTSSRATRAASCARSPRTASSTSSAAAAGRRRSTRARSRVRSRGFLRGACPSPRHCRASRASSRSSSGPTPGFVDRRRADERHRLGEVPTADRGGRLPGRRRRRARAGARRREPPRRQHGRRPARRGAGDDDVPQPDRDRARGGAAADHGRQLSLLRARGRAQVPPGQGDRQLDLAEGGRGASSSSRRGRCGATGRASSSWRSTSKGRPRRSSGRSRSSAARTTS